MGTFAKLAPSLHAIASIKLRSVRSLRFIVIHGYALLVTFSSSFVIAAPITGPLLNGQFSVPGLAPDPFANWTTNLSIGDRPSNDGASARFEVVGASDAKQLEQPFSLPGGISSLMFDIRLNTLGAPVPQATRDSFQASLYDASFNPLLTQGQLFTSFFTIDNNGAKFFDPTFVSVVNLGGGVERVELNISSLAQQGAVLEFLLLGDNDQVTTSVFLDNVAVVPEPHAMQLGIMALVSILSVGRLRRTRRPQVELGLLA